MNETQIDEKYANNIHRRVVKKLYKKNPSFFSSSLYCYECLNPRNKFTPHRKGYRECCKCKVEKKYSEFTSKTTHAHNIGYRCKECDVERLFKNRYGITSDDYNRMVTLQNNRCAICNSTSTGNRQQKYLSIDHCHTTGKVRGLLCFHCNTGIGFFKDNIELLEKATAYLGERNK